MNRQHTPPNLLPGPTTPAVGMSMNNSGVNVNLNSQSRTIPKASSRERRSGLATVMEGLRLGVIGIFCLSLTLRESTFGQRTHRAHKICLSQGREGNGGGGRICPGFLLLCSSFYGNVSVIPPVVRFAFACVIGLLDCKNVHISHDASQHVFWSMQIVTNVYCANRARRSDEGHECVNIAFGSFPSTSQRWMRIHRAISGNAVGRKVR